MVPEAEGEQRTAADQRRTGMADIRERPRQRRRDARTDDDG